MIKQLNFNKRSKFLKIVTIRLFKSDSSFLHFYTKDIKQCLLIFAK